MKGIYQYKDLKTGLIVYVGKDSHINKNTRHKNHFSPSYYDKQVINRVLQNNPDRYEYSVLYSSDDVSDDDLNMLEMSFIERYNPKFNFTKGGDGLSGYKHTKEIKRKISESNKGKIKSDEHKQKISKTLRRKDLDDDILVKEYFDNKLSTLKIAEKYNCNPQTVCNRIKSQGYQLRDNSENRNTSGYFRVSKAKKRDVLQGFTWIYQYIDDNGKYKKIQSISIEKLEKKIKAKGLPWRKIK